MYYSYVLTCSVDSFGFFFFFFLPPPKLSLFADDMILYVENPKDGIRLWL